MTELSFANRQMSPYKDGYRTTFHFTDGNGHAVALLLDGDVDFAFLHHCRIYYESDAPALHHPDVKFLLPDDRKISSDVPDDTSRQAHMTRSVDIDRRFSRWTIDDIAEMLEWEFVQMQNEPPKTMGLR